MGLNTAKINDFSGGLNLIDPPNELPSGDFHPNSMNLEIRGTGESVRCRPGCLEYATTGSLPIPDELTNSDVPTNMKTYRLSDADGDKLIISTSLGKIYIQNPGAAAGLVTNVYSPGGSEPEWDFLQALDSGGTPYVWCLNGSSSPRKMNAATSTVSAWGGTPPNGKVHRIWKTLMVIAGVAAQPQRLYYSQPNNPELWTSPGGFIDIKSTDDENEAIVALEVIGENLLVFKTNSVWLVYDPVSFDNRRISGIGCVNRLAVCRVGETVWWCGRQGVYSTDGDDVKLESQKIEPLFLFNPTFPQSFEMTGFFWSQAQWTRMISTYDDRVILWSAYADSLHTSEAYNYKLVCDTKIKGHPWTRWSLDTTRALVSLSYKPHNVNGALKLGLIGIQTLRFFNSKFFDVLNEGTFDDRPVGGALVGTYMSPWMEIQGNENYERIRRVNLIAKPSTGLVQFLLRKGFDSFGTPAFGSGGPYLSVPLDGHLRWRPEVRSRLHQVQLNLRNQAEIYSVELKYRGGKEH